MLDRRTFLLSTLALAATAACGDETASSAPAASAGSAAPSSGGVFPRTVEHELGSTRLEAAPQRIVCATDGSELCSLLALGLTPVGYGKRNDPPPSWLAGLTDDLDSYDLSGGETSYERLVAWAPDVLLVQRGFATEETLPRFSEIAPTIATSFVDWRDNLRQVGEAVGLEDRAAALEAEKDAAVEALRSDLDPAAAGLRVNAIAAFDDGTAYVLNDQSPLGESRQRSGSRRCRRSAPRARRSTRSRSSSSTPWTATCCSSCTSGTATALPPSRPRASGPASRWCRPGASSTSPRTSQPALLRRRADRRAEHPAARPPRR